MRSETDMHADMSDGPLMEKMLDISMSKAKRDSIHQPCEPIYPHGPAYSSSPIYVKPLIQPTYLKKELGVAPLAHLQYVQQTPYVPKPAVTYVKPVAPAINYETVHQSVQYVKPVTPVYQKPVLSYAPTYQKPLYYSSMYQRPMYHDLMPKLFLKKYETPVSQLVYQKPLIHAPIQYAAPKVVQVQAPQVSYIKPAVHASQPVYLPPAVHNPVIVKPHCL